MSTLQLTFITDAQVDIDDGTGIETVVITDIDSLPAQTKIRIRAVVPAGGYFYAPILDQDDSGVTVLYPVDGGTQAVSAGQALTIPAADNAWLVLPVSGQLRLAVSATPVSAAEWALLPGRDGDAHVPRNSDGTQAAGPPVLPPSTSAH